VNTVYIPTVSRLDMLERTIPRWLKWGIPIRLIVEPRELASHIELCGDMGWDMDWVRPVPLAKDHGGIGYARDFIVINAKARRQKSIIMSDDDVYPTTDPFPLLEEASRPWCLGIGAYRSIHEFFTQGKIKGMRGVILCPAGWGFSLYGLNVKIANRFGFDHKLHSFGEDAELMRQGIAHEYPWMIHCDVKCAFANKRGDPGGFAAIYGSNTERKIAEMQCQELIHKRWPDYTSAPPKRPRMAWSRFYDAWIPNWRERSALHGGHL